MYPHHAQSIQNVTDYFQRDPEVLALLLGGSIAHGFESPISDIDIMIFISNENYQKRFQTGNLHFYNKELCSYQDGYVDGKYLHIEFVKQVAMKGSEPARFAFAGSQVLSSNMDGFVEQVRKAEQYPLPEKVERIKHFYAQFEAWHWYSHEALRLGNRYLLGTS